MHRANAILGLAGLFLFSPSVTRGQAAPKFEVASVKRADRCGAGNSLDPGAIALHGIPLKAVVMEAFSVKMDQIVGPSWLDEDCFDLLAKMPEGAIKDQLPAMFQALLVDRFNLVVHHESHPSPGYALVVDKNGTKLKVSDPNSSYNKEHAGQVTFGAAASPRIKGSITTASLARFLSNHLHEPVQDLTGLTEKYDIDLSWSAASQTDSPTADIFTAVKESLGLKLEPRKEQVDLVVIDHIERVPSEN
jgi:uncharacterized protein (TIGR03435 family)